MYKGTGKKTRQEVTNIIRDKIVYLELKPGSIISDIELAAELEVSRTPVREALLTLQQDRLVDIYPQSGTIVSPLDLNLIQEITYIRHILECDVLLKLCDQKVCLQEREQVERSLYLQELAVKSSNIREYIFNDKIFHRELFHVAGHEQSWDLISNMLWHTTRFHALDFYDSKDVFFTSLQEHKEMIACIEACEKEKLKELLTVHHDCGLRTSSSFVSKYASYFRNS